MATVINCLEKGLFPDELKVTDVSSISKKYEDLNKENYRPVVILPHMSKIFERIFYRQIGKGHRNLRFIYVVPERITTRCILF